MLKGVYKNKNILITGGSSGLGKNMCINYAMNGGRIINISRNSEKMNALNSKLNDINNVNHLYYSADVSSYKEIENIKNDLKTKGIIPDIIINNAAGNFLCPFKKLSENGWKRVIDIVLNGNFNITHIFGKQLIENKKPGVFLNITTTYSNTGSALVIPSAVAKSGVDALMKSLTVEWGKHNIRFVGIAPGPMEGTGGASKLDPYNIFKAFNDYTNPTGRMCKLDEVSNLAMYLTSEKASYINGEIVRIDGGELNKNSGEFNFITNIPYYEYLMR
uniref:Fabg-Like 3-Oxoacyl-(Acyl-Carrier-Protein) Reductase n=1 Tax=Florenciella sp. virus SA2 TaxID=3240092 RepID=A0AB39J6W4_9VIRU